MNPCQGIYLYVYATQSAELDLCVDKKIWETASYGEVGTGITVQINNKHGIKKGDQIVLLSDVHSIRPHAYSHRQNLHVNPPQWNLWRKIEVEEYDGGRRRRGRDTNIT